MVTLKKIILIIKHKVLCKTNFFGHKRPPPIVLRPDTSQARLHGVLGRKSMYVVSGYPHHLTLGGGGGPV
jgi:hypothetical protein